MMKKNLLSVLAASALLFAATSCSEEEELLSGGNGNSEKVSFQVEMDGTGPASRALGDGTGADKLYYEVWDKNTNNKVYDTQVNVIDLGEGKRGATLSFDLVKGVPYDILFWAHNEAGSAFDASDLTAVTMKTSALKANMEAYDAFTAALNGYKVQSGSKTIVPLKRPFAQVNVGTTQEDWKKAEKLQVVIDQSLVTVKGVNTVYNVATATASVPMDLTYALNTLVDNNNTFKVKKEGVEGEQVYHYLGMNYMLADADKSMKDMTIELHDGEHLINTINVTYLPIQRNYRTNVIGNLLTSDEGFEVVIDPNFEKTDHVVVSREYLETAFAQGGKVELFSDITLEEGTSLVVAEGVTVELQLNGYTLKNGVDGGVIVNEGTLIVNNGTILNSKQTTGEKTGSNQGIVNKGKLTLTDVNVGSAETTGNAIKNEGGHIEINGGTFAAGDRSKAIAYAYVFYNISGDMIVNDATSIGLPNGMFSCNSGTITVNGGHYEIKPGANTWYMALATNNGDPSGNTPAGTIYLNSGKYIHKSIYGQPTMGNVIISEECDINWTAQKTNIIDTQTELDELESTIPDNTPTTVLLKSIEARSTTMYTLDGYSNKIITFIGVGEGVVIDMQGKTPNMSNSELEFNNVTFKYSNKNCIGLQHVKSVTYKNCVIEGQPFLYGSTERFNGCTFKQTSADAYNVWTYGAADVTFDNCTFESAGKSVLIYKEALNEEYKVTLNNCILNASSPVEGKAAIEIDSSFPGGGNGGSYTVNINNTTATGFGLGSASKSTLFNQKTGSAATIYVNGVQMIVDGVSKNNAGEYLISNANGLKWVAEEVNKVGLYASNIFDEATIKLTADIDLGGQAWTPIGDFKFSATQFRGTFDGQEHTISNFTIGNTTKSDENKSSYGFFGNVSGTIKNLTIDNATVDAYAYTGVLVGRLNGGNIDNCHVKNSSVKNNYWQGGGLIGQQNDVCSVKNSSVVNTTVTSASAIGAIAGCVTGDTETNEATPEEDEIVYENLLVKDCSIVQKGSFGSNYDVLFGTMFADIDTDEDPVYINNCKVENTKVKGEISTVLFGSKSSGKVFIDGYEMVADGLMKKGVEYNVSNANGLATLNTMFVNKTVGNGVVVNLTDDINFEGKTWTPVDSHADSPKAVLKELNGNGHTISNLTINGQAMFKRFAGNQDLVTIKDVTFDNATVNSSSINTSILTVQSYENILLDNVDVKNSSITGGYKVAPLIATVYNENPSTTVTATLKNCDVENVTVKAVTYDFCTAGMVAFVYADDNDKIEFENCTVKDVKLIAPDDSYKAHAAIYTTGSGSLFNEAEGVTVSNVTFEELK